MNTSNIDVGADTDLVDIPVARTRSGLAAMWERGGHSGKSGSAVVIADTYGGRLRASFQYSGPDHRANGMHALVLVRAGNYIVNVEESGDHESVTVLQLVEVPDKTAPTDAVARARLVARCINGFWEDGVPPPRLLEPAIQAAIKCAGTYGCYDIPYAIPKNS